MRRLKKKQEGGEEGESETNAGIKNKKTYNPYLDVDEDGSSRVNGMYLGLSFGGQTDATAKFFYRTDKGHYTAKLDLSHTSKDNPYIRVLARGHLEIGSYNINTGELTIPNKTGVTQEEIDALIKEFKSLKYGIPAGIFNYKGYKIIYYLDVSAGTFNKKAQTYTPAVKIEVEGYPKIMGTYQPTTGKFFMNKTESPKLPRGPYIHWSAKEQKEFKTKFTEYYHTPEAQKRDIKFIYETVTSEREQTAGSENIVKDNKQGVKQAESNPKNRDTIKTATDDGEGGEFLNKAYILTMNISGIPTKQDRAELVRDEDNNKRLKIVRPLTGETIGYYYPKTDKIMLTGGNNSKLYTPKLLRKNIRESINAINEKNSKARAEYETRLKTFKNKKALQVLKTYRNTRYGFLLSEFVEDGQNMYEGSKEAESPSIIIDNMIDAVVKTADKLSEFEREIERGFIDERYSLAEHIIDVIRYIRSESFALYTKKPDFDFDEEFSKHLREQKKATGIWKKHRDITSVFSDDLLDYIADIYDENFNYGAFDGYRFNDEQNTGLLTAVINKYIDLVRAEASNRQIDLIPNSKAAPKNILSRAINEVKDIYQNDPDVSFNKTGEIEPSDRESYEQRTPREIDKEQITETYGEDEALDNVINSDEHYTRNVALGLDEAAEQVGKLEDAINSKAKNKPNTDLSIKNDVLNAVRAYDRLTKAGASVNAALNRLLKNESVPELKGLKLSDGAIGVLEIFDKVKGSGAKIAAALIKYSENALKAEGKSKQELLTDALNYLDAKDGYQLDLDTRRLEQRIYNILKNLNHEQIDEASAAVYAPVIASRYKFLARITGLSIDDLINRRAVAYRADDSEKRGRGRPRKSETNEFGQATIAQGNGLYNGLNLPFDPADLRTASGANIENAAKSDKILTPDGSSTLGVIDNAMQSQDGTEFPAGVIQANVGAVQYIERRHGNEIRDVGYKDAQTFLLDVLNNYGQIYRGDNNAIILVSHGDAEHSVKSVVSLEQDKNGVYAVNDAGIVRNQYLKNKELLYTRSEPYATSPRTGTAGLLESGQSRGTPKFYATPSSNSEQIINQNLNQGKGGVLRGKIDFDKQGKAIIHILKAANKSTVLHETAHLFLQDFRDLANNPDIQLTEAAHRDWEALCDWLGIKDLDFSHPENWTQAEKDLWADAQEKFAAGTEKYLWEGKIPTKNSRLKRIFDIIKGWFRAIYEKARDIKYINSKGEAVSFNISKAAHDVYDHIHTGGENMASWKRERAANLEIGEADPNEYLTEDKLKDNNFVETTDEIDAKEVADLKAEHEAKAAEDARPKNELGVLEDSEEHINNNNTEVKTLADMSEAITNPKKRGRPKTGGVLEGVKARLRALDRGEMITNLHPVKETASVESEAMREGINSNSMLFTNPETEARFRNSRGDVQVRESSRTFWKDVGLKSLSKNSKSGQNLINAKETFKRLTQSISASTATATNDMKKIIKNLTPAETELFMRKRIIDDLMWRKQEMPEAKLPWGLDGETLKADYERITKLAESNKNVANAIKADEQAISDLNKQMIKLADKLGLSDLSKVLRNPHYFHHEILFNNDLAMAARADNSALGTANSKAEFTGIKTLDDLLNIVLNRSYMKKYKGSELDMNSNYLAVTADIRGQQLQDLAILKALNEIKENYDISGKLREAFNKNKANSSVESYSQEDFLKKLEEQMAREEALRKSKGLKSESEENAGDGSGRAVDILNPRANNTQSTQTAEPAGSVDYVKKLEDSIKNGDTVMGRLDRQLKLKKAVEIGKNSGLIDITDDGNIQIPEGYVAFDPDAHGLFGYDGRRSRIQVALSQGLEAAMTRTGLGEFTIEQIAEAMGHEEAKLWVIPKEVADTLKAFGAAKQPASFKKFLRKITKGWKLWQLFSPTQTIKYNLRNVTGDLDAIIAGNPQSLKYVGQATGELINSMFRGKAAEGELEQYLIRGGDLGSETAQYFTTGFTQAFFDFAKDPNFKVVTKELNNIKSLADFKRLSKRAFKALNKYSIGGIMKLSSFRENILRYATYLSYLEQQQRNENHMPDNWGASLREEIEAIPDIRDRAYKLSNELLGDYNGISELGMRLRDVAVPFYSWLEVNAKRYYRLLKNGIWDGNNKLDFSKGVLKGIAVQSPMIAYNTAKTLLWINALSIAIKAFNEAVNAGSGGADDDLPPEVKDRPHLTFGYTSDGRVSYFDRIGALLDIYDWVGQDSKGMIPFYRDIRDICNGDLSVTDFVKQTSSAAFNKAFNSLTPLLKMPLEIATGRTFYPDATHPRIIRDMTSYIAQSFGLSREVNALLGEPGRDYATWENWGSFKDLFRYTSDPKEGAYFYILDKVRYFQEHTLGKTFDGGAITRRGQALRKFKTAVRYKDRANQRRYLRQYYNLGGTRKTLKQSIKSMGPLTGLSKDEKRQFMRSLTPEDRKYLRRAWRYFYDLAASTGVKVKYEYY